MNAVKNTRHVLAITANPIFPVLCMVLLTVVCIYLASWQITKTSGVAAVAKATGLTVRSPGPFVVTVDVSNNVHVTRKYFGWLFGQVVRFPFPRRFPEPDPMVLGGVQPLIIIQSDERERLLGVEQW